MAPKLSADPGKSAAYYRSNPEAKAVKNAAQRKRNKSKLAIQYRVDLKRERRQRGIDGKGGPDMSHDSQGNLAPESPKKNRARNGAGDNARFRRQ
jgi:hypothetical protein